MAGLLGQSSLEKTSDNDAGVASQGPHPEHRGGISKHARAVASWDQTHPSERIDWYSEYIARHASLSSIWRSEEGTYPSEVRGLALIGDGTKSVGPLDNGSLCVWDMDQAATGRIHIQRNFREISRSLPGTLFEDRTQAGESSQRKSPLAFSGVGECITVDSRLQRAYVAVADILNEIDLETLQVVSQNKYAWPITALSQDITLDHPLTVGTSWSLHLHDSRAQTRERSRSPEDIVKLAFQNPEDSIAFLPNYTKGIPRRYEPNPLPQALPPPISPFSLAPSWTRRRFRRSTLSDYAHCEPGPLSILHQGHGKIFIAGRFPSILSYDQRLFPKLQYVIHSGARLSALASVPYPPSGSGANSGIDSTLLACGEYNGRGSLELYSLPYERQNLNPATVIPDEDVHSENHAPGPITSDADRAIAESVQLSEVDDPFSYKNRQAASSAKLLSVASQGTRIVFSDAEGGLKWVERDGYGLVRRWNVNAFEMRGNGANVQGEQVVRKIIPLAPRLSEGGTRGDGDLLVWTGERIGIVTTHPQHDSESELTKAFDEKMGSGGEEEKAEQYARTMRRALERQADELNLMARLGMRH